MITTITLVTTCHCTKLLWYYDDIMTVFPMLCIKSLWVITGGLHFLIPFTFFAHSPTCIPSPPTAHWYRQQTVRLILSPPSPNPQWLCTVICTHRKSPFQWGWNTIKCACSYNWRVFTSPPKAQLPKRHLCRTVPEYFGNCWANWTLPESSQVIVFHYSANTLSGVISCPLVVWWEERRC